MLDDQAFHHFPHLARSDVALHMQGEHFPRVFIHHAQYAERTTFDRHIVNEVPSPDVAAVGRFLWESPRGHTASTHLFAWWRHSQTFVKPDLPDPFVCHPYAASSDHGSDLVRPQFRVLQAQV